MKRFSTHERVELTELKVVKKNGNRELFDRSKIKKGVLAACEKRPVPDEHIEKMLDKVETKIRRKGVNEIKSQFIGEFVSREIKKLDKVAYIRFASIYREFAELSDFKKEIRELVK